MLKRIAEAVAIAVLTKVFERGIEKADAWWSERKQDRDPSGE